MQEVRGSSPTLGGLRVSQLQSLWRDKHPAIKGLRPPEHHAGKFRQDQKTPSQKNKTNIMESLVAPIAQWLGIRSRMQEVRGSSPRLGGLRVSQLQSLWRDKHPITGLRPPAHDTGTFRQDQ